MNPGSLNKRIKILKFNEVPDGAGGYLDNWQTGEGWLELATVWASVNPLRGRELFQAQQAQSEISHKVIIRHREGIDSSQIIVLNNRRLDISYVINPGEKNQYLELMCVERL